MNKYKCYFCNTNLRPLDKILYYAEYNHFIKNYYKINKKNNFTGIMMNKINCNICIKCAIKYYETNNYSSNKFKI